MSKKCFLCGNEQTEVSDYVDDTTSFHVKCPNCGKYTITEQATIDISAGIYKKEAFSIVAGEVFDSCYYKNESKMVKRSDFSSAKHIDYIEKLYRLAKYFYTESTKPEGDKELRQRPACCYEVCSQEYIRLMKTLEKYGVIEYIPAFDDSDDYESSFLDISMTPQALIDFKEGVNSLEEFKKAFMSKNDGVKVTVTGEKSQVNVVSGEGSITATQNNASNIAELQTLLDRLLQAVPPDTPKETTEQIRESIETIQAETRSPTPKKNLIKTIFTGLGGIVRTAEFAVALAELAQFFGV